MGVGELVIGVEIFFYFMLEKSIFLDFSMLDFVGDLGSILVFLGKLS